MIDQICNLEDAALCTSILAVVSVVYQLIMLLELESFIDMPDGASGNYKALAKVIEICGSFLILRKHTIFFTHQSVKDYMLKKASNKIFPSEKEEVYHSIISRALQVISKTLRRNIYSLSAPGFPIDLVNRPIQTH
jgi:hypothetical protein